VAKQLFRDATKLNHYLPMLEYVCTKYTPGWFMLADLCKEAGGFDGLEHSKNALRRLLENTTDGALQKEAWHRLGSLCQQTQDWPGEAHALVSLCRVAGTPYSTLSSAANRLNRLFKENHLALDSEEKRIVVRELADLMEARIDQAGASDLGRLAWLYLHLHDEQRAREHSEQAIALDPNDEHCIRLAKRLHLA
jgi:hypothetical protein